MEPTWDPLGVLREYKLSCLKREPIRLSFLNRGITTSASTHSQSPVLGVAVFCFHHHLRQNHQEVISGVNQNLRICPVAYGERVTCDIATVGDTDLYRFSGNTGNRDSRRSLMGKWREFSASHPADCA